MISEQFDIQNSQLTLKRCLTGFDLILLGIGAIIGAGIFVITGIASANYAGPAIMISYILAATACAFAALSYAELAASIGGCGSAYGYAHAAFGTFIAWVIGWDLILEYSISVSAVAVGWSHYANNLLSLVGVKIPEKLIKSPSEGGLVNLPALMSVLVLSYLLYCGVKESARINSLMVFIKLSVIFLFACLAFKHFNISNWQPFMPFGWHGVISGASLIFFAYIGFDAVSTAAEEVKDPQKNLPIGIIGSLIVCTIVYIVISGLLTGALSYKALNVASPVSMALIKLGYPMAALAIAFGAIAGLSTVMLVMYFGLSRVIYAMARDGLLPYKFAKLHAKKHTPAFTIFFTGILMAFFSGFFPINDLAELVNIGTLSAFVIVCSGVIALRYTRPEMERPFKTPYSPLVPALGIILCIYLICHLPMSSFIRFGLWMALGLSIYYGYGKYKGSKVIPFS